MSFGYVGRVLKVDLSSGRIEVEQPDDAFYRTYVGGRALSLAYLLQCMGPGVDPLSAQNVLVFAPGVITGAPVSGQGRNAVAARSPLTGGLGSAEAGGFWGYELKRAGFDAVVISGRASQPLYLLIADGQPELRDATHVWGRSVGECEDAIRKELSDKRVRTALIGPAGENLVRYAAIANDRCHFAGRTGLGAVMGSKLLKGIAVRSSDAFKAMQLANPAAVQEVARWMAEHMDLVAGLYDAGTSRGMVVLSDAGSLPSYNFQSGQFDGADKISGYSMRDTILVGRGTCAACVVRCKREVKLTHPYQIDPRYGGPEYETMAALGSCVGVDDLHAVAKANELCAANGMDTISAGLSIAFATECFERGLISEADTGGLRLRWGDGDLVVQLVEQTARREGFGDGLAEGSARLAQRIGKGAFKYALQVKGQELPLHEPRVKHGMALGFALSPTGADHMHNLNDDMFVGEGRALDNLRAFDPTLQPMPGTVLNEEKMRMYAYQTHYRHFLDSAVMCAFPPYSPQQVLQLVNGATGWDMDLEELQAVGRRSVSLARVFNAREGFTSADDTLPERVFRPLMEEDACGARPIDPVEFQQAKRSYYRLMGWDEETGIPTREALSNLGIGWAADHLPQM